MSNDGALTKQKTNLMGVYQHKFFALNYMTNNRHKYQIKLSNMEFCIRRVKHQTVGRRTSKRQLCFAGLFPHALLLPSTRSRGLRAGSGRPAHLEGRPLRCCRHYGGLYLLDCSHLRSSHCHAGVRFWFVMGLFSVVKTVIFTVPVHQLILTKCAWKQFVKSCMHLSLDCK